MQKLSGEMKCSQRAKNVNEHDDDVDDVDDVVDDVDDVNVDDEEEGH